MLEDSAFPSYLGTLFSPSVHADIIVRDNPAEPRKRIGGPVSSKSQPFIKEQRILWNPRWSCSFPGNVPLTTHQVNADPFVRSIPSADRSRVGLVNEMSDINPPRVTMGQTYFNQDKGTIRKGLDRVAADEHAMFVLAQRVGSYFQLKRWAE